MKTILILALLTALSLTAEEAPVNASKPEGNKLESPKTEGKQTYAGTRAYYIAKASAASRPTTTSSRVAATVQRVNLRRPTATSSVGASQVNRAGGISGAGTQ